MSRKKGVTLAQVAKDAGVSPTTVSFYLNDNFHKMSPETKEKIRLSIEKLGYKVNPLAKGLITGRVHTIGLVWSNNTQEMFEDLYFMHFAKVIKQQLKRIGYKLMLFDADEILENIEFVDGVIVKATLDTERLMPKMSELNMPIITIGRHNLSYDAQVFRVDDLESGRCGVEHLLSQGYRDIVLLTYPHGYVPGFDDRLNGASQVLKERGFFTKVLNGEMTERFGYQTVVDLARNGQLPQALFCLNDITAIGALRACKELGISVPTKLAILGVDDMPTVAELLGLSTIRHPIDQLAEAACERMVARIDTEETDGAGERIFPVELVRRETS